MFFTNPYLNRAAAYQQAGINKQKELDSKPGKPVDYSGESVEVNPYEGESIEVGPLDLNLNPNNLTRDEIMNTQRTLARGGFDLGPTGVDGVWGPKTQAAYDASGQQGFSTNEGTFVNELDYHSSDTTPNVGFSTEVQGTPIETYANEPEYNAVVGGPPVATQNRQGLGGLLGNILRGIFGGGQKILGGGQPRKKWQHKDGQWVQNQQTSGQFDMPVLQGLLGALRGNNKK